MVGMILFINTEFLGCFATGFIAGGMIAAFIMGIRAVVRMAMRVIRKA